jgi:transcriptional regulator with XRE-family HTH domain
MTGESTIPTLPDGITFSTAAERFGWNLRIARHRARLRQQDLADRMGVYQSGISGWERGKAMPNDRSVRRLADTLGIEPSDLLRGTEGLAASA